MASDRIHRALTDARIRILSENLDDGQFIVQGVTSTYKVHLKPEKSCTCMDFILREQCCKHLFFIIIKVLKSTHTHPTYAEILSLLEARKNNNDEHKTITVPLGQRKEITEETECPICMDKLHGDEELLWCDVMCGNAVHRQCMMAFTKFSKKWACVLCRANWRR